MKYLIFIFLASGYFVGAHYIGDSPINISATGSMSMLFGCILANLAYGDKSC